MRMKVCVDKEYSITNKDESIADKEDSGSEVEVDDSIADENVLQDKMTDHYLDH